MYSASAGLVDQVLLIVFLKCASSSLMKFQTQFTSTTTVLISLRACCNLYQACVALQKIGFTHGFSCISSWPCNIMMSDMKSRSVTSFQVSFGLDGFMDTAKALYLLIVDCNVFPCLDTKDRIC